MKENLYVIIIYSENVVGVLNLVTAVFTRNQVNIESINASPSGIPNVHKYTISVITDEHQVQKLVKHIERKIDVVKADYYLEEELFETEVAIFKLSTATILVNPDILRVISHYSGKVLEMNETYATVQTCTAPALITELYRKLARFKCILQYTRSGAVAITRSKVEKVSEFLKEEENRQLRFLEDGINHAED